MKSILALGVGLVVALAPGGTALADPAEVHGTGQGHGYGNCSWSSAGGDTNRLTDPAMAGKGNGGWVQVAKLGKDCVQPGAEQPVEVVVTPPTLPVDVVVTPPPPVEDFSGADAS